MSFYLTIDTDDPEEVVNVVHAAACTGRDFTVEWIPDDDDVEGDEIVQILSAVPPTDAAATSSSTNRRGDTQSPVIGPCEAAGGPQATPSGGDEL